jgi:Flp pilus assembly protein TadG
MVEFALGLPMLLLILIAFVEVGIAVMKYNVVSNVAREGARYASTITGIDTATWQQTCNVGGVGATGVTYVATSCMGTENIVSTVAREGVGLDPRLLTVTIAYDEAMDGYNRGREITVTVTYTHPLLLAAIARDGSGQPTNIFYIIPTSITMQSRAMMHAE